MSECHSTSERLSDVMNPISVSMLKQGPGREGEIGVHWHLSLTTRGLGLAVSLTRSMASIPLDYVCGAD